MADATTTVLNPGSGGDSMDETLVTHSDGVTQVKRARVDVGFGFDDPSGRVVEHGHPLPVHDDRILNLLQQMADDIREMKMALLGALSD